MVVTRSDVARAAGVSPAVVSYVINNGPRPVAEKTRQRVEKEIERLNYRPNAIASALRGGATRSIGVMTPNPRNPYFAELSEAFDRELTELGFVALTGFTHYDQERAERYLRTLIDRRVDGLIVSAGVTLPPSALTLLREQPLVVIDSSFDLGEASSISTEPELDAAMAVDHLQQHSHRLIGCIASPRIQNRDQPRTLGWREQQRRNDAPAGEELIAIADASERGGYEAALQLLSEHGRPWTVHGKRPTALFVTSDIQAIGAMAACHELGLSVPADIAIASIDGTRLSAFATPPLTTVRQDLGYIAHLATRQLLSAIEQPGADPQRSSVRGNLLIGRSCGCFPAASHGPAPGASTPA